MAKTPKTLKQKFDAIGYRVTENGRWIWNGRIHPNGYGALERHTKAHRASYKIFKGPIPPEFDVCHRCDNPPCVNPDHLFPGTRRDNMRDCKSKGRLAANTGHPGERNPSAKLTAEQVRAILREHWRCYGENKRLAGLFGVHHSTIHLIVKGKTWQEAV